MMISPEIPDASRGLTPDQIDIYAIQCLEMARAGGIGRTEHGDNLAMWVKTVFHDNLPAARAVTMRAIDFDNQPEELCQRKQELFGASPSE